jgi:hypothetical protein
VNGWLVLGVVVFAVVAIVVAQYNGWIDLSNKDQNSGPRGGAMGAGDEVFNPTRHEAQIELDRQTVLPAPAPLAGDGDLGGHSGKNYAGKVEIDLDEDPARPSA